LEKEQRRKEDRGVKEGRDRGQGWGGGTLKGWGGKEGVVGERWGIWEKSVGIGKNVSSGREYAGGGYQGGGEEIFKENEGAWGGGEERGGELSE